MQHTASHRGPQTKHRPRQAAGRALTRDLESVLQLQRTAGNQAVTGLLDPVVMGVSQLMSTGMTLLLQWLQSGERVTESSLTDALFYAEHPALQGRKLEAGTPEALRWLQIRNLVARPLLRPSTDGGHKDGAAAPASVAPPGLVPTDEVAAESAQGGDAKAAGGTTAGTADKYFTQNVGHYEDTQGGKPRIWLYGSSGANVCNMTSLTMSLVSLAGESEVRSKLIAHLRSSGMHEGAKVKVGKNWVSLAEALDDAKIASRIETLDLVTAVAIGLHGGYKDVTEAGTIARVARETGLATATVATGEVHLTSPKVRESAAQMLASGKRVILGTVNHYIYLLEVRDNGVIVHDPAGARVTPGLEGKLFLHAGGAAHIAAEFLGMDADRQATAVRRVSTNPQAAALVNELARVAGLKGSDRAQALRELEEAHPGEIATGADNFYATSEFAANDLRLRVSVGARAP